MGPNWKIRVARTALEKLGIDGNAVLKHGIGREVYAIPLAKNWREILLGNKKNVHSYVLPASEISDFCLNRWIIPRSDRDKRYETFDRARIMERLLNGGPESSW